MSLAPLRMSVPAWEGPILKGAPTYPPGATGRRYPLAVLAHQYPTTRDRHAPLAVRDEVVGFLRDAVGV